MEIWKDIPNYEGLYQVSNLGRVKSILFRNNIIEKKQNKILNIHKSKRNGRMYVCLYKNNIRKNCVVHRLVGNAFIPNPYNMPQINHIDGNPSNNKVENLEWCDANYNCKHAYENHLTNLKTINEKNKKAIIRNDNKIYDCAYSAAKDMNVSVSQIRNTLKKRQKTCIGYTFEYL